MIVDSADLDCADSNEVGSKLVDAGFSSTDSVDYLDCNDSTNGNAWYGHPDPSQGLVNAYLENSQTDGDEFDEDCDGNLAPMPLDKGDGLGGYLLFAGDLVITEFMKAPDAVSDANGEWIELYNASDYVLNVNGLIVQDANTDSFTISVSPAVGEKAGCNPTAVINGAGKNECWLPNTYLVLATDMNSGTNGGNTMVNYAYPFGSFALANAGADRIRLRVPSVATFDTVDFSSTSPWTDTDGATPGLSLFLSGAPSATSNDNGANWSVYATGHVYGAGDRGSPGAAN